MTMIKQLVKNNVHVEEFVWFTLSDHSPSLREIKARL